MLNATTIRLGVKNWGPIREGVVSIKPLTVFIGPNNTGKSYLAMLFYALVRSINKLGLMLPERELESELDKVASKLLSVYLEEKRSKDIINKINCLLSGILSREMSRNLPFILKEELERIYSSELSELVRFNSSSALIKLEVENPFVKLLIVSRVTSDSELKSEEFKLSIKSRMVEEYIRKGSLFITPEALRYLRTLHRAKVENKFREMLKEGLKIELALIPFGTTWGSILFGGNVHYLPASRAGILHSYRSVAKALISLASAAPVKGIEIPGIPGPLADFLGELIFMRPRPKRFREKFSKMENIVKSFEKEILEGEVTLLRPPDTPSGAPPILIFKFNGESLPIARVSSMIAEVAPLSILLRYGPVEPGDTLIVEEPEAHLHPDKQAKLATFLAKLINEVKIRLLITTHSEVILAKLSNLVSLSGIPPDEAIKLGYTPSITLTPEKVAVYSFEPQPDGVVVTPIKVTHEGIPDDVFYKVLKNLYEETMNLHYQLQKFRKIS